MNERYILSSHSIVSSSERNWNKDRGYKMMITVMNKTKIGNAILKFFLKLIYRYSSIEYLLETSALKIKNKRNPHMTKY